MITCSAEICPAKDWFTQQWKDNTKNSFRRKQLKITGQPEKENSSKSCKAP